MSRARTELVRARSEASVRLPMLNSGRGTLRGDDERGRVFEAAHDHLAALPVGMRFSEEISERDAYMALRGGEWLGFFSQ